MVPVTMSMRTMPPTLASISATPPPKVQKVGIRRISSAT